jgi:hypothetical protein
MVRAEMERTYGADNVVAVNVVGDTRKLDPLLAKYEATKQQLDDLNSNYRACVVARGWGAAAVLCAAVCAGWWRCAVCEQVQQRTRARALPHTCVTRAVAASSCAHMHTRSGQAEARRAHQEAHAGAFVCV